jgi:hypothetical protein
MNLTDTEIRDQLANIIKQETNIYKVFKEPINITSWEQVKNQLINPTNNALSVAIIDLDSEISLGAQAEVKERTYKIAIFYSYNTQNTVIFQSIIENLLNYFREDNLSALTDNLIDVRLTTYDIRLFVDILCNFAEFTLVFDNFSVEVSLYFY